MTDIVRSHGRVLEKRGDGSLVNDTSWDLIDAEWRCCIDDAVRSTFEIFGPAVVSVYVRGSVPRGLAIRTVSDLDLIVLVREPQLSPKARITATSSELVLRHGCVSRVDIEWFSVRDVFENKNFRFVQCMLKVQSLLLWGEDLTRDLPEFYVDLGLATLVRFIEVRAQYAHGQIESGDDPDYWISWIMRTLIRSAMEVTLPLHDEYTRDLSICVALFEQAEPKHALMAHLALELAVIPSGRRDAALELIDRFVPILIERRGALGIGEVDDRTLLERKYG